MASVNYKIGLSNIDKQNMAQDVYERLIAMCFDAYSSSSTYELNAFVVYDEELYKCIEAISIAEAWDGVSGISNIPRFKLMMLKMPLPPSLIKPMLMVIIQQ